MASSEDHHQVVKETVSRCTTETASGAHTFEIVGYSLKKGIGAGRCFESGTFDIGEYTWILRFRPDGLSKTSTNPWLHLALLTPNAMARVWYSIQLVKQLSGAAGYGWSEPAPIKLSTTGSADTSVSFQMKRDREQLEAAGYLHDDRLAVRCELTVVKATTLTPTAPARAEAIEVPPPDITAHLRRLLEGGEGADVTFLVAGERFPAHRAVLFTRSPVLRGRLLGPMRDKGAGDVVAVDDVQPEVFRALLYFIYTDALPDLGDLDRDDYCEMVRHLLVAADMYAMDRLKVMCQKILAEDLGVETVATTLVLADQQYCEQLKDVCIEFLNNADEEEVKAVMDTKGYANLKRSCPSVLVEVYERSKRRRKTRLHEMCSSTMHVIR